MEISSYVAQRKEKESFGGPLEETAAGQSKNENFRNTGKDLESQPT